MSLHPHYEMKHFWLCITSGWIGRREMPAFIVYWLTAPMIREPLDSPKGVILDRRVFQMPTPMKVTGRTSSITNAFVNSIIPSIMPSDDEIAEALSILGMTTESVVCAYCGDPSTEWDHLRPIVRDKQPTGFISEIGNLVPACGKCNQSKGNKDWRDWMLSDARLSPKSRRIDNLHERIGRLEAYDNWRPRSPIDFRSIVGECKWELHWQNHEKILDLMRNSQVLADEIKSEISVNHSRA